jgi:hypothetical protein
LKGPQRKKRKIIKRGKVKNNKLKYIYEAIVLDI